MLSIVLLWIVIYLSGMLICKISGEKGTSQLWRQLVGFFFLFFCQGILFFTGQMAGWSFGESRKYLTAVLLSSSLLSVIFCRREIVSLWEQIRQVFSGKIPYARYKALGFWLFLGFFLVMTTATTGNRSDAMVETVQTTLMTDTMNQFHPFTRQPLELGIILSKKLITLPFWYSSLSVWTGFGAVDSIWILGSLVTAFFSLMAFGELAELLFFRDFRKSWLLVILMELMYLSGDYYIGAVGYRQLLYGYSGEVIVATVMLPGILCILYRFFGSMMKEDFPREKEGISLWGMLLESGLCLGSCVFLTSYAWGIVIMILGIILFFITMAGVKFAKREKRA